MPGLEQYGEAAVILSGNVENILSKLKVGIEKASPLIQTP